MNTLAEAIVADPAISGTFIEMGYGPCVQHAISAIPGASRVLVQGSFPNGKKAQERIGKPENVRSVSLEAVQSVLRFAGEDSPEDPTIFVSSWQIPSDPNKAVETHGWIGVRQNETERFFHLTLTSLVENTRERARELIAEAGLAILASKGGKIEWYHGIDIAHSDSIDNSAFEQFEYLAPDQEHVLCFDENGKMVRIAEFLRSRKSVCLFKGSFNPVTVGHQKMAQIYEEQTGEKPVFAISVNTVDKGVSHAEDLRRRITLIQNLGYGVIVLRNGEFVKNLNTVRQLGFGGNVSFLCGADTKTRLGSDDIETLRTGGAAVYAMERAGHIAGAQDPLFRDLEWDPIDCSSTRIRNRESGWEKLLPIENVELYRSICGTKEAAEESIFA